MFEPKKREEGEHVKWLPRAGWQNLTKVSRLSLSKGSLVW